MDKSQNWIPMEDMQKEKKSLFAEQLGEKVGKILQRAANRANNLLKPYGYLVEVKMQFKELENKKD